MSATLLLGLLYVCTTWRMDAVTALLSSYHESDTISSKSIKYPVVVFMNYCINVAQNLIHGVLQYFYTHSTLSNVLLVLEKYRGSRAIVCSKQ